MTRGERNFNPGNIRRIADVVWDGENPDQSSDPDFVVFLAAEYGIRAIALILKSYAKRGLNTVQGIINRWAPPSDDNNTAAYVAAVCVECGVDPTAPIDVGTNMPNLVVGIIQHENGENIYTPEQIESGIELANNGAKS
jgi:hypothetical protein